MGLSLILMEFKSFRASEKERICRDSKGNTNVCVRPRGTSSTQQPAPCLESSLQEQLEVQIVN